MKLVLAILLVCSSAFAVDFEKDIKPIFEERCAKCHGEEKQKSEFRLDIRDSILKGGDLGEPGAVPGHPEKSTIYKLITLDEDHDDIMPPKGDPLTKKQIDLIAEWIKEGVKMPEKKVTKEETLWSLNPVSNPGEKSIDSFLEKKLSESGLSFSPAADPITLLRRVQVVLTGLLPSPAEAEKFRNDWQQNSAAAYEKKVDELLATKHFGERWAQHWLDAIRWSETSGSESNLYRNNAWKYRDYVINSFNKDKPYNQFIVDQIAGDQTGFPRATGFLVSGPHVPPATVGQEPAAIKEARYDRLDQIMQTLGASMMGLTLGCARCHSHKFDPIKINDYYSILANFQGFEFGIRVPQLHETAPRVKKAREIMVQIESERKRQNKNFWVENWLDHHQVHFKASKIKAIKLTFPGKSVVIDELEIFGETRELTKLADISTNFTGPRAQIERLTDGEIGSFYALRGEVQGNQEGYLVFSFDKPQDVKYFSISKNKKEINNTDYIIGNKYSGKITNFKLDVQYENGQWLTLTQNITSGNASKPLQKLILEHKKEGPEYEFIGRFIDPVTTYVLKRGSPASPGAEAAPGALSALTESLNLDSKSSDKERRMKFAQWLASEKNPLTARVMVNRLWHHTFGSGIVSTLSDFGNAGAKPSHPELLDYLAYDFMKNGWSIKKMLKKYVMSKAFKQSNTPNEKSLKIDVNSTLLWRYPPRRAEAEVLRDSILKLTGSLNAETGGKSYRIHNVKKRYELWEVVDNFSESTWRRMIYQERMRGVDDQMFTAFDFPDCGQVLSKRPSSTTPLQALNLMNSKFIEIQCSVLTGKVHSSNKNTAVKNLFETVFNRQPTQKELQVSLEVLKTEKLEVLCRALLNSNEFVFIQ